MYNYYNDNKILKDVLGRELKDGDFVYFFRYYYKNPINYGIIESINDRKICTRTGYTAYNVDSVYLITNPDEIEQEVYKEIYKIYKEKNNL